MCFKNIGQEKCAHIYQERLMEVRVFCRPGIFNYLTGSRGSLGNDRGVYGMEVERLERGELVGTIAITLYFKLKKCMKARNSPDEIRCSVHHEPWIYALKYTRVFQNVTLPCGIVYLTLRSKCLHDVEQFPHRSKYRRIHGNTSCVLGNGFHRALLRLITALLGYWCLIFFTRLPPCMIPGHQNCNAFRRFILRNVSID